MQNLFSNAWKIAAVQKLTYIRLMLYTYPWPHDHKLRKFVSLKLYSKYLNFYLTHCFNNLQIWKICTLQHNINTMLNKILVDF